MARAVLIVNPTAARANARTPARVARVLTAAGWQVDLATTTGPTDAGEFARQAVTAGAETVAVFGGDGTTMQAAAALVGTDVALGFIPGGTGNLLAGNLDIPRNPDRAARVLLEGRRRRIDLGRVELSDGMHYFGVACGAGADAWVMGETAAHHKRRWGMAAYWATLARVLPRFRNTPCRITIDDQPLDVSVVLILILNCGIIVPPLVRVRPEVNPEDGVLDLLTVTADSALGGIQALFSAIRNGYRRNVPPSPYLRYARGTRFTVVPTEPLPVQFDGDPCGVAPFTVDVVPRALTVLAG